MKSTFSRTFTAAAAILVLTLLTLGAAFQALVKEYLEDSPFPISAAMPRSLPTWRLPTAWTVPSPARNFC